MEAVFTEALGKSFGGVRALDSLHLRLDAGCVFGLLGPNGAGKSTTVRLLNGTLAPSTGWARVLGLDPRDDELRRRIATLAELSGMYERLTVRQNLQFFATLYGIASRAAAERIDALLEKLQLSGRGDDRLGTFSTGMKKRVQLARVLLHRPACVFLDEPTEGLDPEASAATAKLIRALAVEEGTTVFLCTHNLPLAEGICDRFGFIRKGVLVAQGSADEVVRAADPVQRVEITTLEHKHLLVIDDRADVDAHVGRLRAAGERICEVRLVRPTLLDAYLHHVGADHA